MAIASIACRQGETVCAEAQFGGYTKNGGFAEYILADPEYVAHIPKGLDPKAAAPLICAGVTSYKGIKETKAKPGDWIAISGVGGLGHLAIQYAKAMGLSVCAVDIDDGKLEHARKLGADLLVNAKDGDPAAAVAKGTDGGAHGVLITAPSLIAFQQGVGMMSAAFLSAASAAVIILKLWWPIPGVGFCLSTRTEFSMSSTVSWIGRRRGKKGSVSG